jgi:hypothetical protein
MVSHIPQARFWHRMDDKDIRLWAAAHKTTVDAWVQFVQSVLKDFEDLGV